MYVCSKCDKPFHTEIEFCPDCKMPSVGRVEDTKPATVPKQPPENPDNGSDAGEHEDPRREYEDLKNKFRGESFDDFKKGGWLVRLIRWVLESYAHRVDADYIRRKYPGAGVDNQAKRAIKIACRQAGIIGGLSGAAVSTTEAVIVATGGVGAPVLGPVIGGSIMADVASTTRVQLRTTYDLSVIHGCPLLVTDVEDCHFILMTALGIKLGEMFGDAAKEIAPKIFTYNVRKLLRGGLRKFIVEAAKRVGGVQFARKVTEEAVMRLAVPGLNIVLSAGLNYWFTKRMLHVANREIRKRGYVVRPLLQVFALAPNFDRLLLLKALIAVMATPRREGWSEEQMNALRYTQNIFNLSDEDVKSVEGWFERSASDVALQLGSIPSPALTALIDYLCVAAALDPSNEQDSEYIKAITPIAAVGGLPFNGKTIAELRKQIG